MSFIASKIFWPFASPANILALLIACGVLLQLVGGAHWRRRGLALTAGVTALMVVLMMVPAGAWLMLSLEGRFPVVTLPERVDGVIVLGGSVNPSATAAWGQPTMNHAADRLVEFAWLARRYPAATLVFTGGSGSLTRPDLAEAPIARLELERMGAPVERVLFEGASRNTYENAVFSRDMVKPKPGETWVLITSAYHMPRSVGIFRKIGWPVVADPVAHYTGEDSAVALGPNLASTLALLDDAVHEWLGLLAYRVMGRTDSLFPGPA